MHVIAIQRVDFFFFTEILTFILTSTLLSFPKKCLIHTLLNVVSQRAVLPKKNTNDMIFQLNYQYKDNYLNYFIWKFSLYFFLSARTMTWVNFSWTVQQGAKKLPKLYKVPSIYSLGMLAFQWHRPDFCQTVNEILRSVKVIQKYCFGKVKTRLWATE